MKHMNDDHTDSLKEYVQYIVGAGADTPIKTVQMKKLDRFGFDLRVTQVGGNGVLRIPFEKEVVERKDIKTAIVDLSKTCAQIKAALETQK
jgi:putative heme iron utilization protein